jgi:predicted phosphoribosyltransferase
METLFKDRREAGRFLATRLRHHRDNPRVIVLALPRGGVPVGLEVARELRAPLDVFLVRKLGAPIFEELAMGAIASGGVRVLNPEVIDRLGISPRQIEAAVSEEERELARREREYRGGRPMLDVRARVVVLVDDGLATGATMRAAVQALRQKGPQAIIVAVPVGAPETCGSFRAEVDEVVCGITPEEFRAVGTWYHNFGQTTDEEVRELLEEGRRSTPARDERPPGFKEAGGAL